MTTTFVPKPPIWCAGCGHFGVHTALTSALRALDIPASDVLLIAGIGCSGTIQNNLNAYGYHALHGRVLPTATGAALANPGLTVIGAGGDGDGYAIGVGHLVHAFRRNPSIVYLVMNNGVYGLTKGQGSPTLGEEKALGEPALDVVQLGLSIQGASFIARSFVGWWEQLTNIIRLAIDHARQKQGFAFVEVISPCVTYNDDYREWPGRLVSLDGDPSHDPSRRVETLGKVSKLARDRKTAAGVILCRHIPTLENRLGITSENSPALQPIDPSEHSEAFRAIADAHLI